jgi:hypothetical protein
MATNKFLKVFYFLTIAITSFGFLFKSHQHILAQQNYSNPRAANGKLCANCHLKKAIEVEAPQAVLPNSVLK